MHYVSPHLIRAKHFDFMLSAVRAPQMNLAGSVQISLSFTYVLYAIVSNELQDNRHKCAQMKLPHYGL